MNNKTLRAAAQAAWEFMDKNRFGGTPSQIAQFIIVKHELRAALEQPVQSGWVGLTDEEIETLFDRANKFGVSNQELYKDIEQALRAKNEQREATERVPLADDVLDGLLETMDEPMRHALKTFARAIEHLHGIKEQTK